MAIQSDGKAVDVSGKRIDIPHIGFVGPVCTSVFIFSFQFFSFALSLGAFWQRV